MLLLLIIMVLSCFSILSTVVRVNVNSIVFHVADNSSGHSMFFVRGIQHPIPGVPCSAMLKGGLSPADARNSIGLTAGKLPIPSVGDMNMNTVKYNAFVHLLREAMKDVPSAGSKELDRICGYIIKHRSNTLNVIKEEAPDLLFFLYVIVEGGFSSFRLDDVLRNDSDSDAKVGFYYAPVPVLKALFDNDSLVEEILDIEKRIYNEDGPPIEKEELESLCVRNGVPVGIIDEFDFSYFN